MNSEVLRVRKNRSNRMMRSLFFGVVVVILFLAFVPSQFDPDLARGHDKIAHFVAFFVLSFSMKVSFSSHTFRRIFLIMALLAAGIEIFQYCFTSRQFSVTDFGAGMAGVFVYLSILRIVRKLYSIFRPASKVRL